MCRVCLYVYCTLHVLHYQACYKLVARTAHDRYARSYFTCIRIVRLDCTCTTTVNHNNECALSAELCIQETYFWRFYCKKIKVYFYCFLQKRNRRLLLLQKQSDKKLKIDEIGKARWLKIVKMDPTQSLSYRVMKIRTKKDYHTSLAMKTVHYCLYNIFCSLCISKLIIFLFLFL